MEFLAVSQVYLEGYHGDTSETFLIGSVDEVGKKLVDVARRCRDEAIAACRPGQPLCVIGNTIRCVFFMCVVSHSSSRSLKVQRELTSLEKKLPYGLKTNSHMYKHKGDFLFTSAHTQT